MDHPPAPPADFAARLLIVGVTLLGVAAALGACSDNAPPPGTDDNEEANGAPTNDLEPTPIENACEPTETLCDGECVDPDTDPRHCGECGEQCPEGHLCEGGSCVTHGGDCPAEECTGFTYCKGDTGLCRPGCHRDEQCTGGRVCDAEQHTCVCPENQRLCGGACFERGSADACGEDCLDCPDGAGTGVDRCVDGQCQLACEEGQLECDRRCVDCPDGATEVVCSDAGACVADECPEGQRACGGQCVDCPAGADQTGCDRDQCVASTCSADDRRACGGECVDCPAGADDTDCEAGGCVATSCTDDDRRACDGECVDCPTGADDTDCEAGQCIATSCSGDGRRACGGECVDCPTGADATSCDSGQCIATSCQAGDQLACNGECVDCPAGADVVDCEGGQCVASSCDGTDQEACDGVCATCPDGALGTDCEGDQCIATSCLDGDDMACDGVCATCPDGGTGDASCIGDRCFRDPCGDGAFECPQYGCCTWQIQEIPYDNNPQRLSTVSTTGDQPAVGLLRDYSAESASTTGRSAVFGRKNDDGDWSLEDVHDSSTMLTADHAPPVADDGTTRYLFRQYGIQSTDLDLYSRQTGDWSSTDVADLDETQPDAPALGIDGDGQLFGLYVDGDGDFVLDRGAPLGSGFGQEVVVDGGDFTSIEAVDVAVGDDALHVVVVHDHDGDGTPVVYATDTTGSWQTQILSDNGVGASSSSGQQNGAVALREDGSPVVAYSSHGSSDSMEIHVAELDGDDWTDTTVETVDGDARELSLEIDDDGTPHLLYWRNRQLIHARRYAGDWHLESVDSMTGSDGDPTHPAASLYRDGDGLRAVGLVAGQLYQLVAVEN